MRVMMKGTMVMMMLVIMVMGMVLMLMVVHARVSCDIAAFIRVAMKVVMVTMVVLL